MGKYYCEYCGESYADIRSFTFYSCYRHPNGPNKGKHKLYEGTEKSVYTCKYCGQQYRDLKTLTFYSCFRHPNGPNKGKHAPAL